MWIWLGRKDTQTHKHTQREEWILLGKVGRIEIRGGKESSLYKLYELYYLPKMCMFQNYINKSKITGWRKYSQTMATVEITLLCLIIFNHILVWV